MPLIHRITELYKTFYLLGQKIPKRDKFGIQLKIEQCSLELLEFVITATFEERRNKTETLNSARIKTETLKRLIRAMNDLGIMERKKYFYIENELVEISKMITGWIKYLGIKTPQ
ncbi:MAG: four helix bundle protein [Patescibacteria group bacterium]